jgi:hypothetical protein
VIPSLARLVTELAADLPDAVASTQGGAGTQAGAGTPANANGDSAVTSWSVGKQVFAVLGPNGIELRLDPAIAAAATRTPDTGPSTRGPEWIRFNPRELDGHAVDRLTAWLDLGYRRASP